jgi:hypothetical protein
MAALQVASNLKEPRIMSRHTLRNGTLVLVCGVLALAGRPAPAEDGKADKEKPVLSGTWERKDAEQNLRLKFSGKQELTLFPHGDDCQIVCSYKVTKEGLVKAKMRRLEGPKDVVDKAKGGLPIGKEFEFKWKVEEETATLDAVEGEDLDREDLEHLKGHLEGKYAKKP